MNRSRLPIAREIDLLRDLGFTEAYPSPAPAPSSASAAPSAPVAAGGGLERLRAVAEEAEGCTACGLCKARNRVVFGDGDGEADLMFVARARALRRIGRGCRSWDRPDSS